MLKRMRLGFDAAVPFPVTQACRVFPWRSSWKRTMQFLWKPRWKRSFRRQSFALMHKRLRTVIVSASFIGHCGDFRFHAIHTMQEMLLSVIVATQP